MTLQPSVIGHLREFLEWIEDNRDVQTYLPGPMEMKANNRVHINRSVRPYNPQEMDSMYPAAMQNPDEQFNPDDEWIAFDRDNAQKLADFIDDTDGIDVEGIAIFCDELPESARLP